MSKKKKIVLIVAVLLLIGAGVGFYFYKKTKQISSNTPNQTSFQQANAAFLELLGRPLSTDLSDSGTKWAVGIVTSEGVESLKSHINILKNI